MIRRDWLVLSEPGLFGWTGLGAATDSVVVDWFGVFVCYFLVGVPLTVSQQRSVSLMSTFLSCVTIPMWHSGRNTGFGTRKVGCGLSDTAVAGLSGAGRQE